MCNGKLYCSRCVAIPDLHIFRVNIFEQSTVSVYRRVSYQISVFAIRIGRRGVGAGKFETTRRGDHKEAEQIPTSALPRVCLCLFGDCTRCIFFSCIVCTRSISLFVKYNEREITHAVCERTHILQCCASFCDTFKVWFGLVYRTRSWWLKHVYRVYSDRSSNPRI